MATDGAAPTVSPAARTAATFQHPRATASYRSQGQTESWPSLGKMYRCTTPRPGFGCLPQYTPHWHRLLKLCLLHIHEKVVENL